MNENTKNKKLAIVGLGYVGLPLALLANERGYKVVGIDIDLNKIALLNQRLSSLEVTHEFKKIKEVSIIVVCVPTPVDENYMPDLGPVKNACKNIGKYLSKGQLVILESTVNPGVSENIVIPILEKESDLKCGTGFSFAHCPERINPGDKKWNVENINRVIGSLDEAGLKKALAFYQSVISAEIRPMASLKEAEAVKIMENTFRDINIAFVNELAMSFAKLDIDIVNVINGAATKPFAFMAHYPGSGVGGHCIPVDPYYLIDHAKKNGFNHEFLSLARKINNSMPKFAVDLAVQELEKIGRNINNAKVAVLGLAYKPEIADSRESSSFAIIKHLKEYGASVVSFDPFVLDKSSVPTLNEGLKNVDAVIVATGHRVFTELTPSYFLDNGIRIIVDGRNCLSKDKFVKAGIIYRGIGR